MTSVLSNVLGNAILTEYLIDRPTWLALHTEDPTVLGSPGTEAAGGDYARQAGTWSAPGSKTSATTTAATWTGMTACVVTHIGVWSAASGGHMLFGVVVDPPVAVPESGHFVAAAGDLAVTL